MYNNFLDRQKLRFDLKIILTIIFTLTVFGLLFIYSSSCVFASEKFGSSFYFVKKQFIGFFISLIITLLTLVPGIGRTIHGSCRWIAFGGLAFQPSELLKVTLFLYL